MSKQQLVYVTPYGVSSVGNGGNHRAYQIYEDAIEQLGANRVRMHNLADWQTKYPDAQVNRQRLGVARIRASIAARWRRYSENPLRLLADSHFSTNGILPESFVAAYTRLIAAPGMTSVCLIDHVGLLPLVEVNRRIGVKTILCPHNLEGLSQNLRALSFGTSQVAGRMERWTAMIDFANELDAMTAFDDILFISRVEAGFAAGFGLPYAFYPYVSKGEIREQNMTIRRQRARVAPETGLFAAIGTATHRQTHVSLSNLVRNVQRHGLPADTRLVVVGPGTDSLARPEDLPPALDLRGWVEQEELTDILVRTNAVLVPQSQGFGALTRLAELACSGIPVITSARALLAIDPPPGVMPVGDSWTEWCDGMREVAAFTDLTSYELYEAWERRQPIPLGDTVRRHWRAS